MYHQAMVFIFLRHDLHYLRDKISVICLRTKNPFNKNFKEKPKVTKTDQEIDKHHYRMAEQAIIKDITNYLL